MKAITASFMLLVFSARALAADCPGLTGTHPGEDVLLKTTEGATLVGKVTAIDADGITLDQNGRVLRVECMRVDSVHAFDAAPPPSPITAPPSAVSTTSGTAATGSFGEGVLAGQEQANAVPVGGWGFGGFAGGVLCGAVGCVGVSLIGNFSSPSLDQKLRNRSADWEVGYRTGYEKRLQHRRAKTAFIGGTIGASLGLGFVIYTNTRRR